MKPATMTAETLAELIRIMADHVAANESHAGNLRYKATGDEKGTYEVVGSYHIGGKSASSRMHIIGEADEEDESFVGMAEIAAITGLNVNTISNWRKRDKQFPPPIADLKMGPVFRRGDVQQYLKTKQTR